MRLLCWISFAKIAILDLVHGIGCGSAPSKELCSHHWVLLHSGLSPFGLRGVKKTVCLPSSLSLPPAMSPISRTDSMLKEQPFPTVWNSDVTHHFKRYHIPTSGSLDCTNFHQGIFGTLAVLEPRLVTSLINVLKPLLVRELSRSSVFKRCPNELLRQFSRSS